MQNSVKFPKIENKKSLLQFLRMEFNHLQENFFEKILQSCLENEDIYLRQMEKDLACGKGDNFFSEIYRIFLKYTVAKKNHLIEKEEMMSLIVKVESPNINKEAIHQTFMTELKVLQQVMPRVDKFLGYALGPKLFYGNKNTNFLVMEDLVSRGFSMQNRQKGLSLTHCIVAIEKLAKYHAGTVALTEEEPELPKSFVEGMVSAKYPPNYFLFLESSLLNLSKGVAKWNDDECNEALVKLKNIIKTMKTRLLNMYEYDVGEFCVLNHGDYWTNNIMFKNNEKGEPCDSIMIDFQYSIYTSPAIDLQYFLCTCPELEIKCEKDDFFLERYLSILECELKKIGCKTKAPTMKELKKSIYKRRIFSIFSGFIYFPRMTCDKSDVEEFEKVLVKGETKLDFFKNPDTSKALRKLLKAMNERGYLD